MKHEFKNKDGVDEFRVGLSTGKCELKCLKCGNWIRVAPDNMSWVEGCPGERNLKAVYEERVEQSLADKGERRGFWQMLSGLFVLPVLRYEIGRAHV